ncbi:MAG: hypothetical protein EPO24_09850 [Bacteroidetes bacterium]|nr:MAG: hypothetical protein EPO24_09850 [Bacteroidota bacterium]
MSSNFYSRTISLEEEREGYIFILKHRLMLFPSSGQLFTLKTKDTERVVKVEAVSCVCRGAELPHEHYFIRWKGIQEGNHVIIEQNDATPRLFKMVIE